MKTLADNDKNQLGRNVKYYTVAGDILMDILHIIFSNDIRYEIKSVNRGDNSILLYVPQEKQPPQIVKATENIETIINSYKEYMTGLPHDAF